MADLDFLLKRLADSAAQPRRMMDDYLSAGREVAGSFPVYVPE